MDRKTESFYAIMIVIIGIIIVIISATGLLKALTSTNTGVQAYESSTPAFLIGTPSIQIIDNELLKQYQINDNDFKTIYGITNKLINKNDLDLKQSILNLDAVNSKLFTPFTSNEQKAKELSKKATQYKSYISGASISPSDIVIDIEQNTPDKIQTSFDANYTLRNSTTPATIIFVLTFTRNNENNKWYLSDIQTNFSNG